MPAPYIGLAIVLSLALAGEDDRANGHTLESFALGDALVAEAYDLLEKAIG